MDEHNLKNINLNKNMEEHINNSIIEKNNKDNKISNKKSITYFACHFPSAEGYINLSNYKIFRKLFSINIFND